MNENVPRSTASGLEATRVLPQNATVGVVGIGYVGLPLSLRLTSARYEVMGFDVDSDRVDAVSRGESYVDDVRDEELRRSLDRGFEATDRSERLGDCGAVVLAVSTSLDGDEPDMSALAAAVQTAAEQRADAGDETLFVVVSTVYPGAVEQVIEPSLSKAGLTRGEDALVAVVPERIDPGSGGAIHSFPVVVGADDDAARQAAARLFAGVAEDVVPVSSTAVAAASKLLENAYRLVNISLVNEFATFADSVGLDVWEVIDAAATKPFGYQPFYPGPGAGGHCIPVDSVFLSWLAREEGVPIDTLEAATEVNDAMPEVVARRFERACERRGVALDAADVIAFGLTYKPGVADVRNSAAVEVCSLLSDRGASVTAVDPLATDVEPPGLDRRRRAASVEFGDDTVAILLVPNESFAYERVVDEARLVFDVANVLPESLAASENVVRFGGRET